MTGKKSDEAIIAALVSCGSVKAAARECGVSALTIYRRMKDNDFRQKLDAVRDDALHEASARLSGSLADAVKVLTDIMNDEQTAPQTRANAAQMVLSYGLRYAETAEILRRLEQVEQREGISIEKHS